MVLDLPPFLANTNNPNPHPNPHPIPAVIAEEVDAAGDGEVLVVMDLRPDEELVAAGLAREVVNRVQRLRKKAGLQATDAGGCPCLQAFGWREGG